MELSRTQPRRPKTELETKIKLVRNMFWNSHVDTVNEVILGEVWNFVEPQLKRKDALVQFILDFDLANSDFFFPWLKANSKPFTVAMEMAYGVGRDLNGNWTNVPDNDPMSYLVKNDPIFTYHRENQLYLADIAASIQDKSRATGEKSRIIELGASYLDWTRWHGLNLMPEYQRIYAFNENKSEDEPMIPSKLYEGVNPIDVGVDYESKHFAEALDEFQTNEGLVDMVILSDQLSHMSFDDIEKKILSRAYNLLKPGGVFVFDVRLLCPSHKRSVAIFDDCLSVRSGRSLPFVVKYVEDMKHNLYNKEERMEFSSVYKGDSYGGNSTGVMVILTKR